MLSSCNLHSETIVSDASALWQTLLGTLRELMADMSEKSLTWLRAPGDF